MKEKNFAIFNPFSSGPPRRLGALRVPGRYAKKYPACNGRRIGQPATGWVRKASASRRWLHSPCPQARQQSGRQTPKIGQPQEKLRFATARIVAELQAASQGTSAPLGATEKSAISTCQTRYAGTGTGGAAEPLPVSSRAETMHSPERPC